MTNNQDPQQEQIRRLKNIDRSLLTLGVLLFFILVAQIASCAVQ